MPCARLLPRAQRLMASEVRHIYPKTRRVPSFACSTPYGIRGSARDCNQWVYPSQAVLNALWHQRFGTHWRIPMPSLRPGAQRLMASEVRHRKFTATPTPTGTACSTPYGIRGSAHPPLGDRHPVPQRAQRLMASEVRHHKQDDRYATPGLCSTPYGIRGSARRRVAHRAIGNSHECSTPYGIRGSAPVGIGDRPSFLASAQRLMASEVRHQLPANFFVAEQYVLNALWHQRFGTSITHPTKHPVFRAQRLMASEVRHMMSMYRTPGVW